MQAVLVFAPSANPTYMPLGLAFLDEYIRKNAPQQNIVSIDTNIRLWNHISQQNAEFADCRDFMKGKLGNFFDKTQYLKHQQAWKKMSEIIENLTALSKEYLEHDRLDARLQEALELEHSFISGYKADIIGFSVMYPAQVIPSLALAKYISKNTAARKPLIVFGGATITTLSPEQILGCCEYVDAIVQGEGEIALKMLCMGEPFENIPGLCFRGTQTIVSNHKPDTTSLADLPLPLFSSFDKDMYFNPQPVIPVLFSRGCKWRKCRFCAHNFSFGGYRKHNIAKFVDYLGQLTACTGTRHFYFGDQYVDACDMLVLSQEIIARGMDIAFHIMGRPTEDYTPEILQTMSEAGCRWISWGVESGSQRLLDISNKGTKVSTVKKVLADTYAAGISNLPMMIYGLPTSGDEDLFATLDFIDDVYQYCDDITGSSFKLFDKTPFAIMADKYGLKITGRETIFSVNENEVHSLRLFFKEKAADGTYRAPRGRLEVDRWKWRRQMMRFDSPFTDLCCEHYLLYARHLYTPPVNKPIKTASGF